MGSALQTAGRGMGVIGGLFGLDRAETARWAACFIVVAGLHAMAALSFVRSPPSSDFEAGAPVVMLELPEVPAAPTAPPSDLAPGPPEMETEATPPPKEETKPPEEEAEVALPTPEPPKPQPPVEQREATATPSVELPPSTAAPPTPGAEVQTPAAMNRWQTALAAHLERFKRYPAAARVHHEQGIATVAFTIDHEGRLLHSAIVQSSGSPALDQETLDMVARAQPMPKPPENTPDGALSFVVPVRFNIR
jgi:periplasmic protein TonB